MPLFLFALYVVRTFSRTNTNTFRTHKGHKLDYERVCKVVA